jgi:hypothetical protein
MGGVDGAWVFHARCLVYSRGRQPNLATSLASSFVLHFPLLMFCGSHPHSPPFPILFLVVTP